MRSRSKEAGYPAVWNAVCSIPRGKVATYGAIAALCGRRGHARFVGYALHGLPPGSDIPWHRVINARGLVSLPGAAGARQTALLVKEGVEFVRGRVDLGRFGWRPAKKRTLGKTARNVRARPASNR